jgi:hypothetical protein
MNAFFSTHPGARRRPVIRNLALVAVVGLCCAAGSAAVHANETTGRVVGKAPAGATVLVRNDEFGIQRKIETNAKGRYLVNWLPIGVYTVTVVDNGKPLAEHPSVQVFVDRGSRVDFNCIDGRCSEFAAN